MKKVQKILLVRTNILRPRRCGGPPLGCLYLAGAVRQGLDPKISIRIVDMRVTRMTPEGLSSLFRDFAPDVVGFSTLSIEHDDLIEAARRCKAWNPDCLTVVGGPHASMFADLLAADPNLDVVVRGEGERTFVELLKAWEEGRGLHDVPGVVFMEGGRLIEARARPSRPDLDVLPTPAWDLLDIPAYSRDINANGLLAASPYMDVMTSRGCPYGCVYCHGLFGKGFRARSIENVITELETLYHQYGIREIHFFDDCFNLKKDRVLELCDRIIARGLRFKIAFPNAVRGDLMDREIIERLKAAGTYLIGYSIETSSERLQKLIHKNLDLEKTVRAINATYDLGLIPAGFFMLGLPTETREEMEETIRFACGSRFLKSYFFTAVPFPRTEFYELAQRIYPPEALVHSNFAEAHSYASFSPYYSRATGIDVAAIQRSAYRRFYLNPLRIIRILLRFPKNIFLLRGIVSGILATSKLAESLCRRSNLWPGDPHDS